MTYNANKARWQGGDARTLYAFVDQRASTFRVEHGGAEYYHVGPNCTVRVATRAEAEEYWQSPLSPGWTVHETRGDSDAKAEVSK